MKILEIHGSTGKSSIRVGDTLGSLGELILPERTVIITDENIHRLYGNRFPDCPVIEIGTGEGIKTLDTVREIFDRLVAIEVDRSYMIAGIGGGIVSDIAGFIASTYLRGMRFGFVSTTLLSQVDASVGGKNGVNFSGYKNMVGVFNQPEFVICDTGMLSSLPKRELGCGFAEIVKHGAIADAPGFAYLEEHAEQALNVDQTVIERIVYDSVVVKSKIVNLDEREKGERRKLNFGHTFGHAVEKVTQIPHGEAVSIGMVVAARLSEQRTGLGAASVERLLNLLERLNLPTRLNAPAEKVLDAMKRDKKREGGTIHFVLLQNIGKAVIEEISLNELKEVVNEMCKK